MCHLMEACITPKFVEKKKILVALVTTISYRIPVKVFFENKQTTGLPIIW